MRKCITCKCKLPPLNGVEENDFSYQCDECKEGDALAEDADREMGIESYE